jgi:hypothetical protein
MGKREGVRLAAPAFISQERGNGLRRSAIFFRTSSVGSPSSLRSCVSFIPKT